MDLQRGIVVDTAVFVVTSAGLHASLGLLLLEVINALSSCAIIRSLAADIHLVAPATAIGRCSVHTDLLVAVSYSASLSLAALALGWKGVGLVTSSPGLFAALYGPYFEVLPSGPGAYIVADVMTKTSHDGRVLVYEGYLVELSITGTRSINFVCLESASSFYLNIAREVPRTTPRHQFRRIDGNSERISRITIPGTEIANLVTRSYTVTVQREGEDRQVRSWSRRSLLLLRWFRSRRS